MGDKVSIITAVYDAEDVIEDTIRSVLGQSYPNVEYLIVDGGSSDATVEICKRYEDRLGCLISERDEGLYDALNKGVRLATGEWIGIMNAGDVFSSADVLSRIFDGADLSGVDVVYGNSAGINKGIRREGSSGTDITKLRQYPVYRHGASFVRRSVHLAHLFDLSKKRLLGYSLDYYQIYQMFKDGCVFRHCPVCVLDYQVEGMSHHPYKSIYYNYLITHELHLSILGLLSLLKEWTRYFIFGIPGALRIYKKLRSVI